MNFVFMLIAVGFILTLISFTIAFIVITCRVINTIKKRDKNALLFSVPMLCFEGFILFVLIVFAIKMITGFS